MKANKLIKSVLGIMMAANSFAGDYSLSSMAEKDSNLSLSQVQSVINLKKPDSKSGTRINLVISDLGGSTDVSPTIGIYLSFWRDGEMGNVSSLFMITQAFGIVDMHQIADGTLVLELKEYDGEKGMVKNIYQIDYNGFAKKFEKTQPSEEFQDKWVEGEIQFYPIP